jgi:hypothetical protein
VSLDFYVAVKRHQLLDVSDAGIRQNFNVGFRTASPSDIDAR